MSGFLLVCGLMAVIAAALVAWPLLRRDAASSHHSRGIVVLTIAVLLLLPPGLYVFSSNWSWNAPATPIQAASAQIEALREQVAQNSQSIEPLLQLANAYVTTEDYAQGAAAYQRAYEMSKGGNLDAITGWAEALVLGDPSAGNGRAAVLIEEALKLDARHPRALWYGGLIALQLQNLAVARDRFQTLLQLNPPDTVRKLLERQVLDLNEQLGEGGALAASAPAAGRSLVVQVTLSEALRKQLTQPVTLFVLARNPQQPGAPLAVERHGSDELPLRVELSVEDAMLPTRTLMDAEAVEVVARLSASGTPNQNSGDLYGIASYSFKQGEQGALSIEINQRVP